MLPPVLSSFKPDLVLYDAGVDPHKGDSLGRLSLSDAGILRRELQVRSAFFFGLSQQFWTRKDVK